MEAVRFLHGLPLYEPGHATHMYGPLLTLTTAAIFKLAGFNLILWRTVFSLFGIALAAFLATLLCRRAPHRWFLAFVLLAAVNLRANLALASAQPEIVAAFLSAIALYLWAAPGQSVIAIRLVSIALFLGATLFKQTSAAVALIPPVYTLCTPGPVAWRKLLGAALPAIAIASFIGLSYFVAPLLFQAIIAVPASIHIDFSRVISGVTWLLTTFPIFVLGLIILLAKREPLSEVERWVCCSILVLVPTGVLTLAKSGGAYNSLLFAYLAMAALFVSQVRFLLAWIESLSLSRRTIASLLLALSILSSYSLAFEQTLQLLSIRYGDDKRAAAIATAFSAGPGIISPEDPSIAYRANGYFGRSMFFELDAHAVNGEWPATTPSKIGDEVENARGVIEVNGYLPLPLFRRTLVAKGFAQVPIPCLENSAYSLWMKQSTRQ